MSLVESESPEWGVAERKDEVGSAGRRGSSNLETHRGPASIGDALKMLPKEATHK